VSSAVGIDLSSRQLDLVKLDEQNIATHLVVDLELIGKRATAWERTLALRDLMPTGDWWDEVYLVAIEAPYGAGPGTVAVLNRVVGALAASLPKRLRMSNRCWIVRPDEWKTRLNIQGKPSEQDLLRLPLILWTNRPAPATQDARDALCLAYFARETNEQALRASA
jgi:hypothetical protein